VELHLLQAVFTPSYTILSIDTLPFLLPLDRGYNNSWFRGEFLTKMKKGEEKPQKPASHTLRGSYAR
jgi:hypothetical protein